MNELHSKEYTKKDIEELLLGAVGDKRIVRYWWNSPNYQFGLKTPNQIFSMDGGPKKLYDYVYSAVVPPVLN